MLAVVLFAVLFLMECDVRLNGLAWQLCFLVLPGCIFGGNPPEGTEDWQIHEEGEEEPCLEASSYAKGEVARDAH